MKRLISFLLCCLTLLSTPANAATPKIVDDAGLLTLQQVTNLEKKALALTDTYHMDIVIVTVWGLDGKFSQDYADDYFDYNGYGVGTDYSGILLLLSMEYRDWAISTCGEGIYALPDHSVQTLFSSISDLFTQDSYYLAFDAYLDALELYLQAYQDGETVDHYDDIAQITPRESYSLKHFLISLVVGLSVAAVVLFIMIRSMNTARQQHGAASYIKENTYSLNVQRDLFLYSQLRKVRRSDNSSSGGSHRSSSGRSHGGGHGKF